MEVWTKIDVMNDKTGEWESVPSRSMLWYYSIRLYQTPNSRGYLSDNLILQNKQTEMDLLFPLRSTYAFGPGLEAKSMATFSIFCATNFSSEGTPNLPNASRMRPASSSLMPSYLSV